MNKRFIDNLEKQNYPFAKDNASAITKFKNKIQIAAQSGGMLTYSQLVNGVTFTINEQDRVIDTLTWQNIDRRVVGDLLAYITLEWYKELEIVPTMIIVEQKDGTPSQISQNWLRDMEAYRGQFLDFWISEVSKTHTHFKKVLKESQGE